MQQNKISCFILFYSTCVHALKAIAVNVSGLWIPAGFWFNASNTMQLNIQQCGVTTPHCCMPPPTANKLEVFTQVFYTSQSDFAHIAYQL